MHKQIFVNLAVKDLKKTMSFWQQLGYGFNMSFTDENAACLVLGENIFAMLLSHATFKQFTPLPIADSSQVTEVLTALSLDDKADVTTLVEKVIKAGGRRHSTPKDYGFMVQDGFTDLDGHVWEVLWMDPKGMPV